MNSNRAKNQKQFFKNANPQTPRKEEKTKLEFPAWKQEMLE